MELSWWKERTPTSCLLNPSATAHVCTHSTQQKLDKFTNRTATTPFNPYLLEGPSVKAAWGAVLCGVSGFYCCELLLGLLVWRKLQGRPCQSLLKHWACLCVVALALEKGAADPLLPCLVTLGPFWKVQVRGVEGDGDPGCPVAQALSRLPLRNTVTRLRSQRRPPLLSPLPRELSLVFLHKEEKRKAKMGAQGQPDAPLCFLSLEV